MPLAGDDGPTRRVFERLLEGADQVKGRNWEGETTACTVVLWRIHAVIRVMKSHGPDIHAWRGNKMVVINFGPHKGTRDHRQRIEFHPLSIDLS